MLEEIRKDETSPRQTERRRGRKPGDAEKRRSDVIAALTDLEASRTPFSMADLAERAGISRATLYRDAHLRDLIGKTGEGPVSRPIRFSDYEKQKIERDKLAAERRTLRRTVREREQAIENLQQQVDKLETNIEAYAQRIRQQSAQDIEAIRRESYAEGFSQGIRTAMGQRGAAAGGARRPAAGVTPGALPGGLAAVASRIPKTDLLAARRNLARVLHPDLFAADDPATATLATELLKQINALAAEPGDLKKP